MTASFASILGENYKSTEVAIKELVDNAWDADSTQLKITMPKHFCQSRNYYWGQWLRNDWEKINNEYLFITRNRTSQKEKITPQKKRKVKSKK